jgi:hypothetical protein
VGDIVGFDCVGANVVDEHVMFSIASSLQHVLLQTVMAQQMSERMILSQN